MSALRLLSRSVDLRVEMRNIQLFYAHQE